MKKDVEVHIREILRQLPEKPGVYQHINSEGEIIYVGKAKNLKRRVQSYFTKEHESRRTASLVRQIYDLKYIVVNTENDALNLENRMIKAHQPKYNVLLKDGKSYIASVGNAKGGDRYFKVVASFKAVGTNATENAKIEKDVKDFNEKTGKWVYTIGSYSADSMSKTRKDLVKAKEEPKKDDAKKDEKK